MIRLAAFLLAALLSACSLFPRPVQGVPAEAPWFALPLGEWLGEGRAEPEAIAACRPPDCGPGLAVSVVRMSGEDAAAAARILADPGPLAQALQAPRSGKPSRTAAALTPLQEGSATGFAITLARRDGARRTAYGAALGQRSGEDLRVVLVIGEDASAVQDTARRVARRHLGA